MRIHPEERNGGGDQVNKGPRCIESTRTIRPADEISRERDNSRRSETETSWFSRRGLEGIDDGGSQSGHTKEGCVRATEDRTVGWMGWLRGRSGR